jgi:hypothetical protein
MSNAIARILVFSLSRLFLRYYALFLIRTRSSRCVCANSCMTLKKNELIELNEKLKFKGKAY